MNCIHIIDKYYLRSDELQWIISEYVGKNEKGKDKYSNKSYHSDPHQAIISLGKRLCRENNCSTLGQPTTEG